VIFVSPVYLSLLALAAGIILLYFLHTRRQRHEVSALFLWEELPNDPRTRAARIRIRIDALLLLQLLVLVAVVLALAQPAFLTKKPRLAGLAIVLDGSASLHGRSADGRLVADLARSEASALLDRYPTTPVALLELSTSPRVLAPVSTDHERVRRAIAAWEPTWFGNGTGEDLTGLLASQGGTFERVVLLTDGQPAFSLPDLEVVPFSPGENLRTARLPCT
jgi:Ca-activated chloride channel family protein